MYQATTLKGEGLQQKNLLSELGCEKIAYIGRGSKINNATRKRKDGFISYCEENGINYEICELLGSAEEFNKILDKFYKK